MIIALIDHFFEFLQGYMINTMFIKDYMTAFLVFWGVTSRLFLLYTLLHYLPMRLYPSVIYNGLDLSPIDLLLMITY